MSDRGQASTEYVAVLALAALAFVTAGAVAGLGEIPAAVASTVRTGVCIVAGDICRDSDARAAGLQPCTVADRARGGGTTFSVGWLRIGGADGLLVARRSDGSVVVTKSKQGRGGVGAGIGLEATPLGIKVGVWGSIDFTIGGGSAWEFPTTAAAARFLAGADDVPPTWRFGELGGDFGGEVSASLAGVRLAGVHAGAGIAEGARRGLGQTTLYLRGQLDSGANVWAPRSHATVAGPGGQVMIELTLEGDDAREIAFRTAERGPGNGQVVDTVARLDLRDPRNRAAAESLLVHGVPAPPGLLALIRYTVRRGTVERAVYDVRDSSGSFAAAVKLVTELGLEAKHVEVDRRLVAASAWTHGSHERLRGDCIA
ncbi:MAG TPA: hypothetical protein VFM58_14680 [Solirubrobacteraceae bacterium]|nr:hypothetical protein [Solirubrobacteraceae bacterium]